MRSYISRASVQTSQDTSLPEIMCGRYALGIRAAFVRHRMQQENMQVDNWVDDDEARETYNFAPGYNGLVYRANVPDAGATAQEQEAEDEQLVEASTEVEDPNENHGTGDGPSGNDETVDSLNDDDSTPKGNDITFRLQAMRWGKPYGN